MLRYKCPHVCKYFMKCNTLRNSIFSSKMAYMVVWWRTVSYRLAFFTSAGLCIETSSAASPWLVQMQYQWDPKEIGQSKNCSVCQRHFCLNYPKLFEVSTGGMWAKIGWYRFILVWGWFNLESGCCFTTRQLVSWYNLLTFPICSFFDLSRKIDPPSGSSETGFELIASNCSIN